MLTAHLPRHRSAIAAIIAGAVVVITSGAVVAADPIRLTVDSPPLTMTLRDMMGEGPSMGDLRVFEAPATTSDGQTGTRWFFSVTTDMMGDGDATEDRIGILAIDLGDGDSIVIGGVSVVVEEGAAIPAGTPLARPILGGTGRFAGIRGEVVTTRTADGSYHDELTILGYGSTLDMTLDYVTDGGTRTAVDLDRSGDDGMGIGDVKVVEVPYTGADGLAGTSRGVHVRTGVPTDAGGAYSLIGMLVNDFGDGDRLFAAGVATNATDGLPPIGMPMERAIIGGTGRFAGARGVLVSTHVGDGVVEYEARLLTAAPDGAMTADAPWTASTVADMPIDMQMAGDGPGLGDIRAWQHQVAGEDGLTGTSDGLLFTVGMPDAEDPATERLGLWFDRFSDGSQLAVAWTYVYDGMSSPMDAPTEGAVVGGTGRFIGASGTVEAIRKADGSYVHVFHLDD